mgnify:FL=1
MQKKTVKIPSVRTRLCQSDRESIIREYYLEGTSKRALGRKYGCSHQLILKIIANFANANSQSTLLMKNSPSNNPSEEIKALRAELLSLKKQLYDEQMRADFYETMVDVAEEMFNIEIRKKADTGQSKGCTERKPTK